MNRYFLAVPACIASTLTFGGPIDCSQDEVSKYAFCQSNEKLVEAYRSALLSTAEPALQEGLRNRFPKITLSIDEQAARIRDLVVDGRLSPRTLALIEEAPDSASILIADKLPARRTQ